MSLSTRGTNKWSHAIIPPYAFMSCLGTTLPFNIHYWADGCCVCCKVTVDASVVSTFVNGVGAEDEDYKKTSFFINTALRTSNIAKSSKISVLCDF